MNQYNMSATDFMLKLASLSNKKNNITYLLMGTLNYFEYVI